MKTKKLIALSVLGAAFLPAVNSVGDDNYDLHINGDFRGISSGYCPAPGWTLTADGGNARILRGPKHDEFILELTAAANRSQSAVSDPFPIYGNTLKIELNLRGSGSASIGYEALDAARQRILSADRQNCQLSPYDQKIIRYFPVNAAGGKYIRIRLTAEAGSTALFRDVDAEFKVQSVPVTAPGMVAAPPAPAAAPPAPAAAQPVPTGKPLQHEQYYSYRSLADVEYFQVSLPAGSEIEFNLGENVRNGLFWNVAGYDAGICRIKLKHDQEGIFPFRWDQAEFELKALNRGYTQIVLTCGGKKMIIHFTVL